MQTVAARARAVEDRAELKAFMSAVRQESARLLAGERQRRRVREAAGKHA